eukprot:583079-Pyramimonas_sp.AAC.1
MCHSRFLRSVCRPVPATTRAHPCCGSCYGSAIQFEYFGLTCVCTMFRDTHFAFQTELAVSNAPLLGTHSAVSDTPWTPLQESHECLLVVDSSEG